MLKIAMINDDPTFGDSDDCKRGYPKDNENGDATDGDD